MSPDVIYDIVFDALRDSLMVFAFVLLVHILLSFVEHGLSNFLVRHKKTGPIFGSIFGLIPQCGTSVMGADLYIKRYISLGTVIAIFLSCSDEAFIAILTSGEGDKMIMVLPLMGLKLVIGIVIGVVIDLIFRKQQLASTSDVIEEETCHAHHTHNSYEHKHLAHPLIHSLEIFAYVLVINLVLGFVIELLGKDTFSAFLQGNRYLSPLFASIIGLIPNCASSLLLSELFIEGNLSFGALLSGLLVNAGLGMVVLLKNRKTAKNIFLIIGICFLSAVIFGYLTCLVIGF